MWMDLRDTRLAIVRSRLALALGELNLNSKADWSHVVRDHERSIGSSLIFCVGSVTGPASWLWTILLYIFILGGMMSAAVYYFSGRFERIGAIRLPAERDSRPRLTVVFLDLVDGISQGLNQIANWISDKATSVASFFRSRGRRRNGGYQPVQSIPTSSFDQAREDNCLMDLEEY